MVSSIFRKLATIGVSEFVLIFVLLLSIAGVVAVSTSNVKLQLAITPPPAPVITTILGDSQTKAVMVIGTSTLPKATIRVYAFSTPIFVATTADSSGSFYGVFTSDLLPPGVHEFTAAAVFTENQTTDPAPRVAVNVKPDYTLELVPGSAVPTVRIGNADAATSELLRTLIRNQQAAKQIASTDVPQKNRQANRAHLIQLALFGIIVLETSVLLVIRARRKKRQGQDFWHLGRGFYRLPGNETNTGHQPS